MIKKRLKALENMSALKWFQKVIVPRGIVQILCYLKKKSQVWFENWMAIIRFHNELIENGELSYQGVKMVLNGSKSSFWTWKSHYQTSNFNKSRDGDEHAPSSQKGNHHINWIFPPENFKKLFTKKKIK